MKGSCGRRTVAFAVVVSAVLALAIPSAGANADIEAGFVSRINGLRSSKGLAPLTVHAELTSIGRAWAGRMAAAGTISHNPDFPSQVTANWTKLGENVGMGGQLDSLFQAFVNSPAHYKNLVDPAFTHVGVGVVVANGTIFTSHQFMTLPGAPPAPAAAPARAAVPEVAPPAPAPAARTTTAARPAPAPAPAPVAAPPASAPAPVRKSVAPTITVLLTQLRALEG